MNGTTEIRDAEGKLILKISGRLDSESAPEAEKVCRAAISRYISGYPEKQIVEVDLEDCIYLSSAGIRVLMILNKLCRNPGSKFRVVNVQDAVFEVLNMTGMNMAFPVYKKPRQIEKEGLELLGIGTTGTVYKLDADRVLKVFNPNFSLERIYNEQDITRKIASQGIPCAIPYDIVRVGESYGLIFELVKAVSAAEQLRQAVKEQDNAAIDKLVVSFVDYVKAIHRNELPEHYLPDAKKKYYDFMDRFKDIFDPEDYQYIMDRLYEIPDSNQFLHGDLNLENVVFCSPDMMLIDVAEAKQGDPVLDVNIYRSLSYIGKENKAVFEKMGMDEETSIRVAKQIEEVYYADLSEEEKTRKFRQLKTTSVLRLLILLSEMMPKEFMYSDRIRMLGKKIYSDL